jgi:hypothetical protein
MSEDYDRPRREKTGTSGKAIASLVFGLLFCIPIIAPILAIVLGALGLRDISRSRGRLRGQGLAIAGLVTGSIGFILVGPFLIALLLPAVQRVRQAANRAASATNMKQIGLAFHNYHDTYGTLPPAVVYGPDGKPLYSWRVLLLPFLGEDRLYKQFKLDEPWDSPNNKPLLAQMPKVYVHSSQGQPSDPFATHYQVFTNEPGREPTSAGAIFDTGPKSRPRRFTDIIDGTANTILMVEATSAVPWSKPEDLPFSPDQPLPSLGVSSRTVIILLADGFVLGISKDTDEKTLRALITYNGNEIVKVPY